LYGKYFKRIFDMTAASLLLVILSPVFLVTALLVRIKLGSPVVFSQERPGRGEKIFTLYKFRTMTAAKDERGELLPDEARLTKFGKSLRSASLDELPELYNILRGDMSLVGPRPLLAEYLPHYDDFQKRRHDVRPGLTGLAQINGRNATTWAARFEFDVKYVENISFAADIRILISTVGIVFRREGINSENSATMESFIEGSK